MKKLIAGCLFCGAMPVVTLAQQEGAVAESRSSPQAREWVMPRTEYGHPDLQGTWWFGSRTPLQRPANLGTRATYTEAEVAVLEQGMHERNLMQDEPLDPNRQAPESGARIRQEADDAFLAHYQEPELVPVGGVYRTSVIVDPPDGRIPLREDFMDFTALQRASGLDEADGPEGQPLAGRCLVFGAAVPSLTPVMMNPNLLIVQNQHYVMIMTEMIHDARIVRLDDTHFEHGIRNWMGDSVGRWEGNTLVVHTQDFRPEQSSAMGMPLSGEFSVEERYTLVGDNEIHYAFTAVDPVAYTQPVSGERTLSRNSNSDRIYEFACHEGNYSLPAILRGARRQEAEGVESLSSQPMRMGHQPLHEAR